MPQTIKYIGAVNRWPELPVTGKPSHWLLGQAEERPDAEAVALLATGLFAPLARQASMQAVRIVGSPQVGSQLTALFGGAASACQWYRNDAAISGATTLANGGRQSSYTLIEADAGASITCRATGIVDESAPVVVGSLAPVQAPPDTTAPALGGGITTSNIGDTSATISWSAASDNVAVAGYRYSTNAGASYIDAGAALSATLSGLTASTTYQLRVVAYDSAGNTSTPISGTLTTAGAAADTRPRYWVGAASDYNTGTQAALDAATVVPGGSAGGKTGGPFTVSPGAGQYGWLAVLASASASGVTFTDNLGSGGWQGAGLAGNNTGASPSTSTSTTLFTDGAGTQWRLYRQDYANSAWTGSIA